MHLKRTGMMLLALLLVAGVFACAPKKPVGPPQALLDEIAAVEANYGALAPQTPSAEDTAKYIAAIAAAKDALTAGNYDLAMKNARLARLEEVRLEAMLAFRELEKFNPDPPLTYHYRQQMKASEDAQAAGKIDEAIAAAEEAKKQAVLALKLSGQCIENVTQRLAKAREQLEVLYMPDVDTVNLYWKATDSLPKAKCEETEKLVTQFENSIKRINDNTVNPVRIFVVSAPPDFVRIYGDPIIFQDVTPEGLKTRLARVPVGTKVNFIRCKYVAPGKTYYLVEDPNTGTKGWMAEERVWPERAAQMKSGR